MRHPYLGLGLGWLHDPVPNWFGFVALVFGFAVAWLVVRRRTT